MLIRDGPNVDLGQAVQSVSRPDTVSSTKLFKYDCDMDWDNIL